MVTTRTLKVQSRGHCDIIDITAQVQRELAATTLQSGTVTVFVAGSTAGVSTIEYEPGLIADLKSAWQRIAPENMTYQHDQRWGDGNGCSHVRASLLGPSLVLPFADRALTLGTWQQIVLLDFDNRPRSRGIVLQFMGEAEHL